MKAKHSPVVEHNTCLCGDLGQMFSGPVGLFEYTDTVMTINKSGTYIVK